MQQFNTGGGFSAAAVVAILDRWLQSGGVHANARIEGRPVAQVLHDRLSSRYGAQSFRVFRGCLDVMEQGQWRQLVHRDDIYTFMFGKRMQVKIGPAPDPAEKGVKVDVKVVEYYELDDGGFECSACGKVYKPGPRAESYVKAHIAKEH